MESKPAGLSQSETEGQVHDLLVIGGGPAGSSTAYWAAKAGLDVVFVEKKVFPRDKTCGDGLTPRAVHQLEAMGLGARLASTHRFEGLRTVAHGRTMELKWPDHPVFPSYGYVVKRSELDTFVAENAVSAGATLLAGTAATEPIMDGPLVLGTKLEDSVTAETREVRARFVVIADGANSRFGRSVGTTRNRAMPQGMAIRTYYESPRHDDPFIESALDFRDRSGNSLPGYGWIFPVGDGTINVGVGLLSTFRDWKQVNTSHLMTEFAHALPDYWEIDPENPTQAPTGGRLPMGGSVGPKSGANWLVVGDAAGSVNPFNGEGIDYAYETGRISADLIAEAIESRSRQPLERYRQILEADYGQYFKVARLFAKVIGRPALMRELTRVGMRSETLMDWVLRIMANLMDDDRTGGAEAVYRTAAALSRVIPEPSAKSDL